MRFKEIYLSILFLSFFISCKKLTDPLVKIKDKIIDAYWSDIKNLTIKVEGNEGYVVDFGTSELGTNQAVFGPDKPFVKNITRTDHDSWTAEVVKPSFDAQGKLNGISYEPVTIDLSTNSNGVDVISISNTEPQKTTLTKQPDNYNAPTDPYHQQPISCDNSIFQSKDGNSLSLRNYWRGNLDSSNIKVASQLFMPMNRTSNTKCHYRMTGSITYNGNLIELIISFSHKPTQSQFFTIADYGFGSISPLNKDNAIISLEYGSYLSFPNGAKINVGVAGGKITASLVDVELKHKNVALAFPNCKVTCVLKG